MYIVYQGKRLEIICIVTHKANLTFQKKLFLSLQFEWLSFLQEMFAETNITITKDEPLLSFKGPFFKDFSNLLATTDHKTLG